MLADPAAARDPVKHLTEKGILRYGEQQSGPVRDALLRRDVLPGPVEAGALEWLKGGAISAADAEALAIETKLTEVFTLWRACSTLLR